MESPPSFILRLYQPTDFNAVLGVIQSASAADALPQQTTAEELRARLRMTSGEPRLDPADDMWVAAVREAGVVAYADGWLTGQGAERSYRTDCFVLPEYRGRGLGRALLARQGQRAQAIARRLAAPSAPVTLTLSARAWARQAGAVGLFEARGLRCVRTYLELARDLTQPLAARLAPAGLRLENWLDPRIDEALWRAYDEGFADHWGFSGESFETFIGRLQVGHIQRAHCFIAWAGGEIAGASLNDMDESRARGPAWVRHLFVRRAWRGRGLGRALVDASLNRARQLGYAQAGLMVDEGNQTGALALYAGAGFTEAARRMTYQVQFSAEAREAPPAIV